MNILGIITARGGSKGIPKKNLRKINKKPLIQHTIETAKKSKINKNCLNQLINSKTVKKQQLRTTYN